MKRILLLTLIAFTPALAEEVARSKFERCLSKNSSQTDPRAFCIDRYRARADHHRSLSEQHAIHQNRYLDVLEIANGTDNSVDALVDRCLLPRTVIDQIETSALDIFKNTPEDLSRSAHYELVSSLASSTTPLRHLLKEIISQNLSGAEIRQMIGYFKQQIDFWTSDLGKKLVTLTPELVQKYATSKEGIAVFAAFIKLGKASSDYIKTEEYKKLKQQLAEKFIRTSDPVGSDF
jgi:hypothetical protein